MRYRLLLELDTEVFPIVAEGDIHDSHHLDVLLAFVRAMDQRNQNNLNTKED